MFVLRKFSRSLLGSWRWKDISRIEDEATARARFNRVSGRYSGTCRGYQLEGPTGVIMSAFEPRTS